MGIPFITFRFLVDKKVAWTDSPNELFTTCISERERLNRESSLWTDRMRQLELHPYEQALQEFIISQ